MEFAANVYLVYIFYSLLSSLYICRESSTDSPLFMQNKPNLLDAQMKISSVLTKDYENKPRLRTLGKQTQSNPILSAILSGVACLSSVALAKEEAKTEALAKADSKGIPYCSAERCSGQVSQE